MSRLNVKNDQKIFLGVLVVLSLVVLFLLSQLKISHSIDISGQILPIRELILIRDTNGNLSHTLFNHLYNFVENCSVINFERGDLGQFSLSSQFYLHSRVVKGDTLGRFFSNELSRLLAQLRGELEVEKSLLYFYLTGEKSSIIEEAQQQLWQTRVLADEKQKIYERQQALFDKGLVSQEELEIARSIAEQYRLSVKAMEARLETVSTGAKSAQLDLSRKRIQALENQIHTLELREQTFILLSPISGRLIHSMAPDTALIVVDTTSMIVKMMVKLHDLPYVTNSARVDVKDSRTGQKYEALISRIDGGVRFINNEPVVLVNAVIMCEPCDFLLGIPVECSIHCSAMSLFAHIKKMAGSVIIK